MAITVQTVLDTVELGLAGRGIPTRPNPELLRQIIKSKWQELVGEASLHDGKYTYTTDGTREIELPEGIRRVTKVIVDNYVAMKIIPESRDNTYATEQQDA